MMAGLRDAMTLVKVPGPGVGCRVLLLSAGGGLSARGRVLLAGAGCWVLMAGAEALAGAQWRVRIPGAVGWVPKRRLGRNAGC